MPDLSPTEIDSELTARLGQIVIRWAVLEDWLSHLLANLVHADPGGLAVVTTNVASSTQIQWILTLLSVHVHKQPELQEIIDLVKRADELRGDRNALVHGIWDPTGCELQTCLVNTVKWERTEVIRQWMVTVTDLDQLVSDINEWIADFIELGKRFGFPRRRGDTKSIFLD
jgi:hypothetical protein